MKVICAVVFNVRPLSVAGTDSRRNVGILQDLVHQIGRKSSARMSCVRF